MHKTNPSTNFKHAYKNIKHTFLKSQSLQYYLLKEHIQQVHAGITD